MGRTALHAGPLGTLRSDCGLSGRVRISAGLLRSSHSSCRRLRRPGTTARRRRRSRYSVGYDVAAARCAPRRRRERRARRAPDPGSSRRGGALDELRVRLALARRPGISFVQRVALRRQAAEPALALASGTTVPWEWQYAATHADVVPDRVLRAASRVTIAVVDTGADVSAPDLAAKRPLAFSTRTRTSDVRDTRRPRDLRRRARRRLGDERRRHRRLRRRREADDHQGRSGRRLLHRRRRGVRDRVRRRPRRAGS